MNRREFNKFSTTTALASLFSANAQAQQKSDADKMEQAHNDAMQRQATLLGGAKLTLALLAYPGMFLQDLVGPLTRFEALMNRDIHLVWKNKKPVNAGSLVKITPTTTLKDCPDILDVLFVPGGLPGTQHMMEDTDVLDYNPQPPFNSGSPVTANQQAKKFIDDIFTPAAKQLHETARRVQKHRG